MNLLNTLWPGYALSKSLLMGKKIKLYIYIVPSSGDALLKVFCMQHNFSSSGTINCVIPLWGGATSSNLNSLGNIQAMRLPLGTVNLVWMHITPPLTINDGTHFIYPQRDGGLSQPPARLSQEQVLNLGSLMGRITALPTELSQPYYYPCWYTLQ